MKRLTVIFCSTIALAIAGCNDAPTTDSAAKGDSATAAKPDFPLLPLRLILLRHHLILQP